MTVAEYLNLKAKLPEVEFVYGAGMLAKVKQIKTPEEIAGHKKSCEVTNAIVKDFFEYAKVGMTEKELFELKAYQQEQEINTTYFELLEHQNDELQVFVHDSMIGRDKCNRSCNNFISSTNSHCTKRQFHTCCC